MEHSTRMYEDAPSTYCSTVRQAVAILNRAGKLWGTEGVVFCSVRDDSKPMSYNAMSKALRDMGYQGKATPYGFRSSFSSAVYNRVEYFEQRRHSMQWWGKKLQALEYVWISVE